MKGKMIIIEHVKPNGEVIILGKGKVTKSDSQRGIIEIKRELQPGGKYDGLAIPKELGDYAITEFQAGSWSYRTAYYSKDNKLKGEYYNVNTPIEIYPDRVRYVDLEIDVVRDSSGAVKAIDEGLLLEDVAASYITERLAQQAKAVAASIVESLTGKGQKH